MHALRSMLYCRKYTIAVHNKSQIKLRQLMFTPNNYMLGCYCTSVTIICIHKDFVMSLIVFKIIYFRPWQFWQFCSCQYNIGKLVNYGLTLASPREGGQTYHVLFLLFDFCQIMAYGIVRFVKCLSPPQCANIWVGLNGNRCM